MRFSVQLPTTRLRVQTNVLVLAYLREHATAVGRAEPLDVCLVPFGLDALSQGRVDPDETRESISQLGALGVTWLSVVLPAASREQCLRQVTRFGDEVLARL